MKTFREVIFLMVILTTFFACDNQSTAPGNNSRLKVKLNFQVGTIAYHDTDAVVHVQGFDADDHAQWARDFIYTGPYANVFKVKPGYDHYTVSVSQFGISASQTISGLAILNGNPDASPAMVQLTGIAEAKRPDYCINYEQAADPAHPGETRMEPLNKSEYHYNENKRVDRITFYNFVDSLGEFIADRYDEFVYDDERVARIFSRMPLTGKTLSEISYQYKSNGEVASITSIDKRSGVNSSVSLSTQPNDSLVTATYFTSGGGKFTYNFLYSWKNIVADKVSQWGQLCNQGAYTHDKNINPFKHLGYVNFSLRNYSINNILTEAVDFIACSFPEVIPEHYQYEYDEDGYPVVATTFYKQPKASVQQTRYHYVQQ